MSICGVVLPTYSQDCGLEDQIPDVSSSTHGARASAEIRAVSIRAVLVAVAFEPTGQTNSNHTGRCRKPSE